MKLINHTYDTLDECLHAMIDGTVFTGEGVTLSFNQKSLDFEYYREERGAVPFRRNDIVRGAWRKWQIQAEPDWRDDLSKGTIPCEVSGGSRPDVVIDKICDYIEGLAHPYIGLVDDYTHATPIQDKDCWRAE